MLGKRTQSPEKSTHTPHIRTRSRVMARGLAFHETAITGFGVFTASLKKPARLKAEVKYPPCETRNGSRTSSASSQGSPGSRRVRGTGRGPTVLADGEHCPEERPGLIPARRATHLKRLPHVFLISNNKQKDTWPITL